ncbi:serine O-acetyltransferase [Arthrobacter sp. UYCu511]|uniref:hypothetical protein n=1 Tax=Arthrobacter sp. UYCu511 TaxID=3156337 RepID=UPI0033956B5D
MQKNPLIGKLFRHALKLRGIDIPPQTLAPGKNLFLRHAGNVVVHTDARLGNNIMLHQGTTIGRADIWREPDESFMGFEIQDFVILGANAVVVSKTGKLIIGKGTVLGANSVLNQSTGHWEIWAGNPAKKIGNRKSEQ